MTTFQPPLNAVPADIGAPKTAATPATPAISAKTWIAVIGATLGAFMAVLNIQIVNASLAISRARSAPASTTAAGSRPPI